MNGAGSTKVGPAVTTLCLHGDLKAMTTHALIRDPTQLPVEGEHIVHASGEPLHHRLDPAQIAQSLFPRRTGEDEGPRQREPTIVHQSKQEEGTGQIRRIIADAWRFEFAVRAPYPHVGASWEDGVRVGIEEERRTRATPRQNPRHVV